MILSPSNPFPISFVVGERIQGPHRALSAGFNSQTRPLLCGTNPARLTMVFIKTNSHKKYPHYPHYKPTGIVKRILIKSVFLSSGWVFWQSYTCNSDLNGLTNMATSGQRDSPGLPTPQKYYRDLALLLLSEESVDQELCRESQFYPSEICCLVVDVIQC